MGRIVAEGQLRYYCFTDYVLLAAMPSIAYKIARITWGKDGSIYVQFPYCAEKAGWLGVLPIPSGADVPITYSLTDHGERVGTDVKFAHHPSGVVHFSKSGDSTIPRTERRSWPLNGPIGHLFDLQVLEPERFTKLAKPDRRAMHLGVEIELGVTSISWHAEWRRKRDIVNQIRPVGGVAGPKTTVIHQATGQESDVLFLGQPKGYGAGDHLLMLTSGRPPVPEGFAGTGMTFLGGWDQHEVANTGDKADLGGCLAFVYPYPGWTGPSAVPAAVD